MTVSWFNRMLLMILTTWQALVHFHGAFLQQLLDTVVHKTSVNIKYYICS